MGRHQRLSGSVSGTELPEQIASVLRTHTEAMIAFSMIDEALLVIEAVDITGVGDM